MKNIQKITSAMKMVAASKMRVAQSLTEKSRGLVQPFVSLIGDHPGELCWPLSCVHRLQTGSSEAGRQ